MADCDNLWSGFNVFWNGIDAALGETTEQAVKAWGGKPFRNPATNIAAFEGFLANVVQAIIDSNRNPTPETVTQIENQGVQILSQIGFETAGAEIGELIGAGILAAAAAAGVAVSAPVIAICAVVGAVAGAVGASIYGRSTYRGQFSIFHEIASN